MISPHATDEAAPAAPIDPAHLARLHERLAGSALDQNLVDVAYTTVDSPLGPLLLAASPAGLLRVAFASEGHDDVLGSIAEKVSPRILRAPQRLDEAARELDEYFEHRRTRFGVPLDLTLSRGFRRDVQQRLRGIEYGSTVSYRELAEQVGNPRAVRAVGTACATNPLPIVVPCHRVLRSDGGLGGYLGGLDAKAALLKLEVANGAFLR